MKKVLLMLSALVLSFCSVAQKENPFTQLKYDSILIYDFEYKVMGGEQFSIINEQGRLASKIYKFKKLNENESSSLATVLGKKSSFGNVQAVCFSPHLGIVFYSAGKVSVYITICMDCNILDCSISIPNQMQGKQIADTGDAYYTLKGMSNSLRKHLNNLLKKYDFPHKITANSDF